MGLVELILLFNCGDDKIKSNTVCVSGRFVAVTVAASCLPGHLLSPQEPADNGTFAEMRTAGSNPTCSGSLLETQTATGHVSQYQEHCRKYYARYLIFVGEMVLLTCGCDAMAPLWYPPHPPPTHLPHPMSIVTACLPEHSRVTRHKSTFSPTLTSPKPSTS